MLDRIKQDVVKIVLTVQVRNAGGRAGGRGAPSRSPTCGTSTPTTRKRSPLSDDGDVAVAPPPALRARRREGRPQRSVSRAARARSTSTATASSSETDRAGPCNARQPRVRRLSVSTAPLTRTSSSAIPRARSLHASHRQIAAAGPGRDARRRRGEDQEVGPQRRAARAVCEPGDRGGRRVHAEPLLRGAGHRLPRASCAAARGGQRLARARRQRRQRERRHRRARPRRTRAPTCEAVARLLGCAPEEVLPFSTGVIMEPLPVERIVAALPAAQVGAARRTTGSPPRTRS